MRVDKWVGVLVLLTMTTGIGAWPASYDSFTVTLERYPYCAPTKLELTDVKVTAERGGRTMVEVEGPHNTTQVLGLFDQLDAMGCNHSYLYDDLNGRRGFAKPNAPLPLRQSIYSLSNAVAVVFDNEGPDPAPLACAPLKNPSAGDYGFGASVDLFDRGHAVGFLNVLANGSAAAPGAALYGAVQVPSGTVLVYGARCPPHAFAEVLLQHPVSGTRVFEGEPLAVSLETAAGSASVVIRWGDGKNDLVCEDLVIGAETCQVRTKYGPFWAFVPPYIVYAALCFLWMLLNRCALAKKDTGRDTEMHGIVTSGAGEPRVADGPAVLPTGTVQTGYRQTILGMAMWALYCLLSVYIMALIVLICLDFYGLTWHQTAGCVFGTEGMWWWMLFTWFFHSIWYACFVIKYHAIRNFFRTRCPLADAEEVMMWQRKEVESFVMDTHVLVQALRWVTDMMHLEEEGIITFVPVHTGPQGKFVYYQYQRFLYQAGTNRYEPHVIHMPETNGGIRELRKGLADTEAAHRMQLVGSNEIPLSVPSWFKIAGNELCRFFYVYQTMMTWIYYFWAYWQVALPFTGVIAFSAILSMWVQRQNAKSLAQLSRVGTMCQILRSGTWKEAHNATLVPGDVIQVGSGGWIVPCDVAILSGTCIMDESGLTGESMPQQKIAIPADEPAAVFDNEKGSKKYSLFAGTICLRSADGDDPATAVVLTTGMGTSKGKLLSGILFPKELRFKFDEHVNVVYCLLFTAAIIAFSLAIAIKVSQGTHELYTLFLYACCTCTQVVSPLIPALLVVGQTAASGRLRKRDIYCINPKRITVAGKIRVMCFDKTGTLTKEGLDFAGPLPITDGVLGDQPVPVGAIQQVPDPIMHAMASCHAVTSFEGQLLGNEVEVNMFRATDWQLLETPGKLPKIQSPAGQTLEMIRRFEFDHGRMTMSVAVDTGKAVTAYVKGSFEKIQALCLPETVPKGYHETCQGFAARGFYTLAIARKALADREVGSNITRDEIETELEMLGLILFRNEPKPDAEEAIKALKEGDTRPVMITGDTVLTGIAIARNVGMLPEGEGAPPVVLVDVAQEGALKWSLVGADGLPKQVTFEEGRDWLHKGSEAAVTGVAFRHLDNAITSDGVVATPGGLLLATRVFGRMTPDDKINCVERHKALGLITGMCGDGGNDAGALRASHAGVALSDAEASIVSPFTSRSRTVMSVVDVIREGRCALCTSFAAVKYQIMYALIVCIDKLISYYLQTLMSAFEWIYLDGIVSLGIALSLTFAEPELKLAAHRPTSSLLAPIHCASYASQFVIQAITTTAVMMWLRGQPFFVPFDASSIPPYAWWLFTHNYESTTFWILMSMQALSAGLAFSLGGAYRRSPIHNHVMMCVWSLVLVGVLALFLPGDWYLAEKFELATSDKILKPCGAVERECQDVCHLRPHEVMPVWFRVALLIVCFLNMALVVAVEKFIITAAVAPWLKRRFPARNLPLNP